jgi:hypothetical protein
MTAIGRSSRHHLSPPSCCLLGDAYVAGPPPQRGATEFAYAVKMSLNHFWPCQMVRITYSGNLAGVWPSEFYPPLLAPTCQHSWIACWVAMSHPPSLHLTQPDDMNYSLLLNPLLTYGSRHYRYWDICVSRKLAAPIDGHLLPRRLYVGNLERNPVSWKKVGDGTPRDHPKDLQILNHLQKFLRSLKCPEKRPHHYCCLLSSSALG